MNAAVRRTPNHRGRRRDTDRDAVVIQHWTGREANAFRCAARMSASDFAEYLGVSARAVSRWAQLGVDTVPRLDTQAALDTALAKADPATRRRFNALVQETADV